jgi:hypothetical protein
MACRRATWLDRWVGLRKKGAPVSSRLAIECSEFAEAVTNRTLTKENGDDTARRVLKGLRLTNPLASVIAADQNANIHELV